MIETSPILLPCVTWGAHTLTRLILGHNPIKGWSHRTEQLNAEMRDWHTDPQHSLDLLRRSEECGINTVQFGGAPLHELLHNHHMQGGRLHWVATLYANTDGSLAFGKHTDIEDELKHILAVNPAPIGIQHFGESTDRLYFEGHLARVRERLKLLRDSGLLVGVCTHLPEVVEEITSQGWDVDFFQTSLYTAYTGTRRPGIHRSEEVFDDSDRERMLGVIRQVQTPCLVFKALGASRKCTTPQDVKEALAYAYNRIKPIDVICVGMWQKNKDQVAENTQFVREILEVPV